MLSHFPSAIEQASANVPTTQSTYNRNYKEDMKEALDLFFKFRDQLDKLHPECTRTIERMLQVRY